MRNGGRNKIKLLKLYEMLMKETDADHHLTTNQICDRLNAMDIPCDRRTLTDDIDTLINNGYEVKKDKVRNTNKYWTVERPFEKGELRVLADGVRAARFIPKKITDYFIERIGDLGGRAFAKELEEGLVDYQPAKHTNMTAVYALDDLHQAILDDDYVTFRYFDLDHRAERRYRLDENGREKVYEVEPVGLIYNSDFYYLRAYAPYAEEFRNYRVDRMADVKVDPHRKISLRAKAERCNLPIFNKEAFRMFDGRPRSLTLEFPESDCNAIFDIFGEDVHTSIHPAPTSEHEPGEEPKYRLRVEVRPSPVFYSWLVQYGGRIRIVEALHDDGDEIRQEFRALLEQLLGTLQQA